MPEILIVNGEHIGIFTSAIKARKYAKDNGVGDYQIIPLHLFYKTDFGDST